MQNSTFSIIRVALAHDQFLSKQDRAKILAVCKNPSFFVEPTERWLPKMLTITEVAEALKVSRCTVWRMAKEGRLHALDFNSHPRFLLEDIERAIGLTAPQPTAVYDI